MAMYTPSSLLDLPPEILLSLVKHLYSLEDLYKMMLTCKSFRNFYKHTSKHNLRLAAQSSPLLPGLQPYPHFLVALVARRLACWAVESQERRDELHERLGGGMQSLLDLAIEVVDKCVTLDDINQTWEIQKGRLDTNQLLT